MGDKSKRPRLRISLRTFMVVLSTALIGLGLVMREVHEQRSRMRYAERIRLQGGLVRYSMRPKNVQTGVINGYLRVFLGDEFFTEVEFIGMQPQSSDDLLALRCFPEVTHLSLSGSFVTDKTLEMLGDFPVLCQLAIRNTTLGEQGLKSLREFPAIESLDFVNCELVVPDIGSLTKLERLRSLEFKNCKMPYAGLIGLPSNLALSFSDCRLNDADLKAFHGARQRTSLRLTNTNVTEAGVLALWEANRNWSVRFSVDQTDTELPSLDEIPLTKEIRLKGPLASDKALVALKEAASLTGLELSKGNVTDAGLQHLQHLQHLQNLEWLAVGGMAVSDDGLRALESLVNLDHLSLVDVSIAGHGLQHLPVNIKYLHIGESKIELPDLGRLTKLAKLDLNNVPLTEASIDKLVELKSLKGLYITQHSVSDETVEHIKRSLPNCTVLVIK